MPKKVVKMVKLQVPAGKATPAPPVGPALGQAGVNIMAFVKEFNERTAQSREIAETKMADLNAADIEAAMRMVEGTARSMGITVVD